MATINSPLRLICAAALAAILAGCGLVYDDGPEADVPSPSPLPAAPEYITLSVAAPASEATGTPGFEPGTDAESFIDFAADGGYRLLLFSYAEGDTDGGTYIATLTSVAVAQGQPETETYEGVATVRYTVTAMLPAEPPRSFRVVMLANCPDYPALTEGTTLASLTEADRARFAALTTPADGSPWLVTEGTAKRLIPLYGVRSYTWTETDVTTTPGTGHATIDLSTQPLPLLRAMAKVEVIVDDRNHPGATLESVKLTRHNARGFCAPAGAFLHSDYFHNYTWDTDFTSTPHLVGGVNDPAAGELAFTRATTRSADGAAKETWVAYVPEYDNTGAGVTPAKIRIRIRGIEGEATVKITDKGVTSDHMPYNLLRNNIYRITITDVNLYHPAGSIKAEPWAYESLPEIIL